MAPCSDRPGIPTRFDFRSVGDDKLMHEMTVDRIANDGDAVADDTAGLERVSSNAIDPWSEKAARMETTAPIGPAAASTHRSGSETGASRRGTRDTAADFSLVARSPDYSISSCHVRPSRSISAMEAVGPQVPAGYGLG